MKKYLLILIIILTTSSFPQITITASDIQNHFAVGNTYTSLLDTTTTSADIGSTGTFSMDLSSLNFNYSITSTSVTPLSTGYESDFPTAQFAVHQNIVQPDITSDTYTFYNLSTDLSIPGIVITATTQGLGSTIMSKFLPANTVIKVPLTMGTTWTSDFTDSLYVTYTGLPPFASASHQTHIYTVDGYGSVTLPGKTIQVLRLKIDSRSTNGGLYTRNINYNFIAQDGESVSISVTDTNAASGVVSVDNISWETSGTVGIHDDIAGFTDYRLLNNYPNPFNPSTKIAYYVPTESKVEISVYNLVGEKVSSAFNGISTQGLKEVNFNAAGLASGTYFYKMNAVSLDGKQSYSSVGKMLLMK